jgi:hypothetical protein
MRYFLRSATTFLLVGLLIGSAPASQTQEKPPKPQRELDQLIKALYTTHWLGARLMSISPTGWAFNFTEPMKRILEIGPSAQNTLLPLISDPLVKPQVIILLGGIGDERAVGPIINAMVAAEDIPSTPDAEEINSSANLALTNITAAQVVWLRGGVGILLCPKTPKKCWSEWWRGREETFRAKAVPERDRYHGPNYGIYKVREGLTMREQDKE